MIDSSTAAVPDLDIAALTILAERALARSGTANARITGLHRLDGGSDRHAVARAVVERPGFADASVIVKVRRSVDPDAESPEPDRGSGLAREWMALQLIDRRTRAASRAPRLIAGDPEAGVLVLTDFGSDATTLVAPLLGNDPAVAERAVIDLATALGNLHAATVGCAGEYVRLARERFPEDDPDATLSLSGFEWCARTLVARLGGEVAPHEIAALSARWDDSGPWTALVHGDPCPDNALRVREDRVELVDFEFAAPGHALRDVVGWHMGFPSCWCAGALPEALVARADAAWRRAVSASMPMCADDDAWADELARVCAMQLLVSASRQLDGALGDDNPWGTARCRERLLHWLRTCRKQLDARNLLPGLRRAIATWTAAVEDIDDGRGALVTYPALANPSRSVAADTRLAMAVVVRAGLVLVQRRWRRGTGFVHEFPGGRAEPDETPARAAARELLEETGLVESGVAHESHATSRDDGMVTFVLFDSSSAREPVPTTDAGGRRARVSSGD